MKKSTLLAIRKCRHDAVYELFFCAFKNRNTLNMRRASHLDVLMSNKFPQILTVCGKLSAADF